MDDKKNRKWYNIEQFIHKVLRIWHFATFKRLLKLVVIAAGTTVVGDVPDYALMAGIPAKQIGWVCKCRKKLTDDLECPDCAKKYSIKEGIK